MQRLKDKIEKWFGEWIEYKWEKYNMQCILDNHFCMAIDTNNAIELSINDLCSPECSFLESLEWKMDWKYITPTQYQNKSIRIWYWFNQWEREYTSEKIDYHRMQLSLLSDEQKILYLINNTK